jgi:hypothetical protein
MSIKDHQKPFKASFFSYIIKTSFLNFYVRINLVDAFKTIKAFPSSLVKPPLAIIYNIVHKNHTKHSAVSTSRS